MLQVYLDPTCGPGLPWMYTLYVDVNATSVPRPYMWTWVTWDVYEYILYVDLNATCLPKPYMWT